MFDDILGKACKLEKTPLPWERGLVEVDTNTVDGRVLLMAIGFLMDTVEYEGTHPEDIYDKLIEYVNKTNNKFGPESLYGFYEHLKENKNV